ncbi:PepSY domain-containing protein [Parabacteroides chongii]|uniref:PepSY domain-containing protein n=1 Tax=Parabacteroides chongii TaxID=2685834 RepID=UPI00240D3E40|nr:PepSY domain-containing protein [Parabacteroides chongii]WFE83465.1 PepSY domain-containing protein [Parabacteroides chongii]
MKKVYSIIYKLHKILSIPLSILFILWYVSGLVMLYHPFPRLNDTIRPVKEVDYAVTDSLWQQVPATFRSCQFIFSGNHQLIKVDGEVLGAYHPTKDDILSIADDYNIIVHHIDTLADIDRWIPFNRLMSHLPIYRLVSNEEDYLYISSQTGEILQYNTKKARLWAYVGAIPHYVYYKPLRRDSELWKDVVILLSGIATISVILGLIISIRFLIKRKRLKLFRKATWQTHYLFGLISGIFMFAFIFSGMMSLAKVPEILIERHPYKAPLLEKSHYDIQALPSHFKRCDLADDIKPIFRSYITEKMEISPATLTNGVSITSNEVEEIINSRLQEDVLSTETVVNDWFYYQNGEKGFKTETTHHSVYWNEKGYFKVMDRNSKARYICYQVLHTFKIPFLNTKEPLRLTAMWILLLSGLVIVISGTILSYRIVRK